MNLREIIDWLNDAQARPAPPKRVAQELNRCPTAVATMVVIGQFYRAIEARFANDRRRQLSQAQMEAIRDACDFAVAGAAHPAYFPNLNRVTIALQLVARVIDPSLINQGNYQLCGPAAVVLALATDRPRQYVTACTELGDRGTTRIRNWQITPAGPIRNAIPNGPAADWIMCASMRADDRAIADNMYGTCGAVQVYDFLRQCGYQQVVLAMDFPVRTVRAEPQGLIPNNMATNDHVRLARDMVALAARGWRVVMFVYGGMNDAIGAATQGASLRMASPDATGEFMRDQAQQRAEAALRVANPSLLRMAWRMVTGTAAAHTMHVTFLCDARIEGTDIKLSCVNFGQHQRWISLPLVDFANKFVGYAAATDIT